MLRQRGLINVLVVVRLADKVDHCLDYQIKKDHHLQQQQADQSNRNPDSNPLNQVQDHKALKQ
ncbi:hypothetical protein A7L41_19005 [Acinetobacter baumannii]|nr:hypothetical protein A7L41_19005 [Acinetobacter baumannii]